MPFPRMFYLASRDSSESTGPFPRSGETFARTTFNGPRVSFKTKWTVRTIQIGREATMHVQPNFVETKFNSCMVWNTHATGLLEREER